jgi:hypothetical protein
VVTPTLFSQVIQDLHELKRRNAGLDDSMPLDRYSNDDPFENHPLFKSEEQARLEETIDGEPAVELSSALPWPGEETQEQEEPSIEDSLWGTSPREFNWGD